MGRNWLGLEVFKRGTRGEIAPQKLTLLIFVRNNLAVGGMGEKEQQEKENKTTKMPLRLKAICL